jgi:hypothetical protein
MHTKFLSEAFKGRDHMEKCEVMLEWILRKLDGKAWTGFIWCSMGPVAGSHECSDKPLSSYNVGNFLSS